MEQEACAEAIDCFMKGLAVDGLCEEFYQNLMRCHEHHGCLTEALTLYERCKKALHLNPDVSPSPQTKAVYRSILSRNGRTGLS